MKKLRSRAGETLVETLAALLLITMTAILFLGLTQSSGRIIANTDAQDRTYRESLSAAEEQRDIVSSGTVTVDGRDYAVTYYGAEDASRPLVSYATGDTP